MATAGPSTAATVGKPRPQPFDYYVVLDFEATCDDKTRIKPQEIIGMWGLLLAVLSRLLFCSCLQTKRCVLFDTTEFPSVLLNAQTLEVEDEIQIYVRPTHHPQLSAFCTELTGITQVRGSGTQWKNWSLCRTVSSSISRKVKHHSGLWPAR